MPIYNPNLLISDCYGSAGSITFYHRDGKCCWRSKSTLSFAATPRQCAALSIHRRALAAWRTIPDSEKERWHKIARNVSPHRPPFVSGGNISGHNLFVSAWHGFHTLGNEHIPKPMEFSPFPVFSAEFAYAEAVNVSDLRIYLRLAMSVADNSGRYALLCKVQLTEAGKGCNPGKMRNFLAEEATEDDMATDSGSSRPVALTIPVHTAFPGVSAANCSLHLRYMLIDRLTGYRSQYQKLSAVIDIT